LGNIFDPFYSKSIGSKGTGLGLPLCYAIVKQHAGTIEVDSAPGQGSTFTVRLDLSPD
jgi:signal transduction histidine kinase